jgi:hypothetical protein
MIGPYDTDNTDPCYDNYCVAGYIYSTYTQSIGLVAVDHRGYLFAPLEGEYTVTAEQNDNIVLIWLGTDAYSGWTRGNADLESTPTLRPAPQSHLVLLNGSRFASCGQMEVVQGPLVSALRRLMVRSLLVLIWPAVPTWCSIAVMARLRNIRHGTRRPRLGQICVEAFESRWLDVLLLL